MLIPYGEDPPPEAGHFAWTVRALAVATLLVYGATVAGRSDEERLELFLRWGFVPAEADPLRSLTSTFLHADAGHVLGNMLFLWVFGKSVEWCLGSVGFAIAYLLLGAAADAAHWATDPSSRVPGVGASGAVSGVLGVYLVAFPRNRILFLGWIGTVVRFWVPAWCFLAVFFVWQNLVPLLRGDRTGIGHAAHLGGFVGGVLLALALRRRAARLTASVSGGAGATGATAPRPARPAGKARKEEGWERWLRK